MRISTINALDINVVDRNDRVAVVVGIGVLRGVLPLSSTCASYPRAGTCATGPGHKPGGSKCKFLGERLHCEHQTMPGSAMPQRSTDCWRSQRPFTSPARLASIR
jgi:hypothetical protein